MDTDKHQEALRAFYRRDHPRFDGLVAGWPKDVRHYVKQLVAVASRDQASEKANPGARA